MLNRIIDHMIAREEEKLGARLDHLREVARESEGAFFKLALATPLVRHRKVLPKTAYHLAVITTTQHEDCGECLQMAIQAAARDHVPAHYVRAALDHNYHLLPDALEDVCAFAQGLAQNCEANELRDSLRSRYGSEGIVELGLVIAGARLFPTLKRALGHAKACSAPVFHLELV